MQAKSFNTKHDQSCKFEETYTADKKSAAEALTKVACAYRQRQVKP